MLLMPVAGGEEQMLATVVVVYPSLRHYAMGTAHLKASALYSQFQAAWPVAKFPFRSTGVFNAVMSPSNAVPIKPGEVLSIFRFNVNAPLDELVGLVNEVQKITGRQMTMSVPIAAGSRGPIVTSRYKDLEAWADATAEQNTNPAIQKLIANFPIEKYRVEFRGLAQVVTIP